MSNIDINFDRCLNHVKAQTNLVDFSPQTILRALPYVLEYVDAIESRLSGDEKKKIALDYLRRMTQSSLSRTSSSANMNGDTINSGILENLGSIIDVVIAATKKAYRINKKKGVFGRRKK